MRSAPALDIAGLTVRYGDTLAVDDVGLVIPTGQTVALGTRGLGGALALLPRVPDRRPGRHSAAGAGAGGGDRGAGDLRDLLPDGVQPGIHPRLSPSRPHLLIVVVLGVALPVWLGTSWTGLLIYVSAAVASSLPERWVWPAVLGAAAISAGVIAWHGQFPDLFILPLMCLLTAMAQERLRFARGLHDLLGHSLSLIALKSELAGRLAELDPARARTEMADVEAAARRALAEVRDG